MFESFEVQMLAAMLLFRLQSVSPKNSKRRKTFLKSSSKTINLKKELIYYPTTYSHLFLKLHLTFKIFFPILSKKKVFTEKKLTIFPHIVSAETILF